MSQLFREGDELTEIWFGPDGFLKLSDAQYGCKSLTVREQYCGDRNEYFVEAVRNDGQTGYHNMRFIAGFQRKEAG